MIIFKADIQRFWL